MDMPHKNKSEKSELDNPPVRDSAKEFFPDFATVRATLEAAQIGVWFWDTANDTVTWSSNLESIHGVSPGAFDGSWACLIKCIHHDDQANVEAALQEAMRTRSRYCARYRVPQRNGNAERWLEAVGTVVDEGGAPKAMAGHCCDVTER